MKVAKWGNSLAVRLPAIVIKTLNLKEGDDIEIHIKSSRELKVARDETRQEALGQIQKLARRMPPGFKFDRTEANGR
jgi:antitoxin MazE